MSGRSDYKRMVILGGGPAGVFAACALKQMGIAATIITRPRPYAAWEGLSERPVQSLRHFGFEETLNNVGPLVERLVHWNGQTMVQNREYIISRSDFDQALLRDARKKGVAVIAGRIAGVEKKNPGWRISYHTTDGEQALTTDFLVEARGREAKYGQSSAKDNLISAPPTSALLKSYHVSQSLLPMTSVATFANGWAWYLRDGKGRAIIQFFISSERGELPPKAGLDELFSQCLHQLPEAAVWLKDAEATDKSISVRTAAARKVTSAGDTDYLLLGDSSMALDPLSGNGIFYAMGSGLAAAPVINSLLNKPGDGLLALQFFSERSDVVFAEGCQMAREFYALEQRWPNAPFWKSRRNMLPGQQPAAAISDPIICHKPVVKDGFIIREKVIITPEQPRGVWQLDNIPLVALTDLIKAGHDDKHIMARLKATAAQLTTARQWLVAHKIIE